MKAAVKQLRFFKKTFVKIYGSFVSVPKINFENNNGTGIFQKFKEYLTI